jgi:hypothetical protein
MAAFLQRQLPVGVWFCRWRQAARGPGADVPDAFGVDFSVIRRLLDCMGDVADDALPEFFCTKGRAVAVAAACCSHCKSDYKVI